MESQDKERLDRCREGIALMTAFSIELSDYQEDMTPQLGEKMLLDKIKKLCDFALFNLPVEAIAKRFPQLGFLYDRNP